MIFFELFIKALMLFFGLVVINARNPVYSVLALILLFLTSSILLIYLGVSFIGMVFLVVYIGAVAVLFLFVVMMINIRYVELTSNELYYLPVNGLLLLLPLSMQINQYIQNYNVPTHKIDYINYMNNYLTISDSEVLGSLLYSYEFGLTVIIASFILLVAMVGSITLTYSSRHDIKKQNTFDQLTNDFSKSISLYDLKK